MSPTTTPGNLLLKNGMVITGSEKNPVDLDRSNVSLLLHGDGANGSTTIVDSSPSPKTVTAFGNAQISTAQSKFGGASIVFDGNGDSVQTTSTDFNFSTDNFTLEGWFYCLSSSILYPAIITNNPGGYTTGAAVLHIDHASYPDKLSFWAFDYSNSAPIGVTTTTIVYDQWNHFAVVRSGTALRLAYNGQIEATTTISASLQFNFNLPSLRIGGGTWNGANGDFPGYLDDLRITKGIARYTTNFTPPTAPFPDI